MNLVLEAIRQNRLNVEYKHTPAMIADGLTKPLKGSGFDSFAILCHGLRLNQPVALGYETLSRL